MSFAITVIAVDLLDIAWSLFLFFDSPVLESEVGNMTCILARVNRCLINVSIKEGSKFIFIELNHLSILTRNIFSL